MKGELLGDKEDCLKREGGNVELAGGKEDCD